jgi:hypothetical protein
VETPDLVELALAFLAAKEAEADAKRKRVHSEEALAVVLGAPSEGQKTHEIRDDIKVTLKQEFSYGIDEEEIRRLFEVLNHEALLRHQHAGKLEGTEPEHIFCPLKSKASVSLDLDGYRWYQKHEPAIFKRLCAHVKCKPKKLGVTVKVK